MKNIMEEDKKLFMEIVEARGYTIIYNDGAKILKDGKTIIVISADELEKFLNQGR